MSRPLLVGHRDVMSRVPDPIPHALLLTGPEGVGKSIAGLMLAYATGVKGVDYQRVERLDKHAVRELVKHHSQYPMESPVRTSLVDLNRATPEAMNALLKVLEEPPEFSRIILFSDKPPMLTIRSRCFNLNFGSLSEDEVREVLKRQNVPEHVLDDAARFSGGRVSVAMSHAASHGAKKHVEGILGAVMSGHTGKVEEALKFALEAEPKEKKDSLEERRRTVAMLMARSVRTSFTDPSHGLSQIDPVFRHQALQILESPARAVLRIRSAAWLLSGMA